MLPMSLGCPFLVLFCLSSFCVLGVTNVTMSLGCPFLVLFCLSSFCVLGVTNVTNVSGLSILSFVLFVFVLCIGCD